MSKAIWEQDVNPESDGKFLIPLLPKLYYIGQKSTIFTWTNYFIFVFTGICHSVIVFVIPYYVYTFCIIDINGLNPDMWIFSVTSFSSVIFVSLYFLM